jgi:hypothetical protein
LCVLPNICTKVHFLGLVKESFQYVSWFPGLHNVKKK